jgi:hypothetical protein
MITEAKYLAIKRESIAQLSRLHPELNVENLLRETWSCKLDLPFFYIEVPY